MEQFSLLEFADRVSEIMPVIIKAFARRSVNELYKGEITFPQFLILEFLNRQGEARMTDLARFMGVSTAAMTGIVDRLLRDGYVKRAFDPKDRRIVKVKTLTKGQRLVRNISNQRRQMIIQIFGRLPETDRQDYLRILTQIKDILTEEKSVIK